MACDFNGTADYLLGASAPVTAVPLSMACWFNVDNITASVVLMSLGVNGGTHRFQMTLAGAVAGDPVRASIVGSATVDASTTAGYSAGVWQHATVVFTSATSRAAYLDGGSKGTNTTSSTPSGIDRTVIGARIATTVGAFMPGLLAECAIWSAALTDDEAITLARGVSPRLVRPQSLVLYAPLVREIMDARAGLSLAVNGTPAVVVHPRTYGL